MISISIMAHPKRKNFVSVLLSRLKEEGFENVPVSWDEGAGIWENCKTAWQMVSPEATHHLVLQDDAVICHGFKDKVSDLIYKMDGVGLFTYQLYFGNRRSLKHFADQGLEKGYVIDKTLWWGVAIILRKEWIEPMIAHGDEMKINQDDMRIRSYLISKKIKACYPMPSLVDHREGESLVGDPGRFRKSFYFADNGNK